MYLLGLNIILRNDIIFVLNFINNTQSNNLSNKLSMQVAISNKLLSCFPIFHVFFTRI